MFCYMEKNRKYSDFGKHYSPGFFLQEWRKAELAAVKATKKWRTNGCPCDADNVHFVKKKKSKK